MSNRNKRKGNLFIDIIHGNRYENHRIVINERVFMFNDINKWMLYLKLIIQHANYLCEVNDKDIGLFLQDIVKQVNNEAKQFKNKMNHLLGC